MAQRSVIGDYIGFTFGGVHSSELGLVRVSDGSRYEEDLLPPLQDKTAQVNGRDGAIYFNSQYNTRPIKVPVAFDNMTEETFTELRRLLADKKLKYLWFDETPYKQWLVKAASAEKFKWVCFDESKNGGSKRTYKGEGTLEFSCFSPYAESRCTFLNEYPDIVIVRNENNKLTVHRNTGNSDDDKILKDSYNFDEWVETSGLIEKESGYETQIEGTSSKTNCYIYNAGDRTINLQIVFPVANFISEDVTGKIQLKDGNTIIQEIIVKNFELKQGDVGFILDSKIKMIKGIDENGTVTGTNYNKYIVSGDFIKVPTTESGKHFIITTDFYFDKDHLHCLKYTHQYI